MSNSAINADDVEDIVKRHHLGLPPEVINERRKELLKAGLEMLRRDAERWGMVITVSQVSRMPPAMGNYDTVIEVREARK